MTICCLLVHVTGFKWVVYVIVGVAAVIVGVAVVIGAAGIRAAAIRATDFVVVHVCGGGDGRVAGAPVHKHMVPNPNPDAQDGMEGPPGRVETIPRAVPRAVQERGTLNSTFFTLYPRLFVDRTNLGVPRHCVYAGLSKLPCSFSGPHASNLAACQNLHVNAGNFCWCKLSYELPI